RRTDRADAAGGKRARAQVRTGHREAVARRRQLLALLKTHGSHLQADGARTRLAAIEGAIMKTALVSGAGGFIGSHLVKRLKKEGFWVRGSDLKFPQFSQTAADDFVVCDLRDPVSCRSVVDRKFDEVYQLAADMGGAGYIFTGENDADVMHNSA